MNTIICYKISVEDKRVSCVVCTSHFPSKVWYHIILLDNKRYPHFMKESI